MKQLLTILSGLLCFLFQGVYGQGPGAKISGTILDQKNNPVAYASISLLKPDSSIYRTGLSDNTGSYEFIPKEANNYFIRIDAVGFEPMVFGPVFFDGNTAVREKPVTLLPSSKTLSAVVVNAKKPMIEVKADKTIFNVEASINATGSNALELLQKSPGVQVDNNDNISMKGKSGVKIYVDGKMLQLDSKELAEYLKNINSSDIEAIEMISNPGAKYDASGNAGIINLRLKKNKRFGTNGSANIGFVQGVTPKGNASVALNYRNKKINIYGNVGGSIGKYRNTLDFYRIQKDSLYDQLSINSTNRKNLNVKAGMDYFINKKNTIGILANVNESNNKWISDTHTNISYEPTKDFVKSLISTNTITNARSSANFNLNYRYADTSGKEYNVDVDYGFYDMDGRSYQPNNYYAQNGDFLYSVINRNNTPTRINIFSAKADAEFKLGKGKFGYGVKTSFVTTKNSFNFYKDDSEGKPVFQQGRSNDFNYTENVNAAYVNYNTPLGTKWNMQAGIRAEQTSSDGALIRKDGNVQADDQVKRRYFDVFPSAAISWNINTKNALNLSYSRRIDRPSYQDLNPFENKLDELTYRKGNAFLRPQYTDNIELTHTLFGKINTSVGYSYVRDYSTEVTDTLGNATYVQERNLATQQIYNAGINANLAIAKWWNSYVSLWYNYQDIKGDYNGKKVRNAFGTYGAYLQQSFNLGKDYSAELSGWYSGPNYWNGTWKARPQVGIDIGAQKQFLNKKLTLKISATDIFHSTPWKARVDFGGLYLIARGSWESQTFRVNATWRFGSNKIKSSRQRQTGLEQESKRVE